MLDDLRHSRPVCGSQIRATDSTSTDVRNRVWLPGGWIPPHVELTNAAWRIFLDSLGRERCVWPPCRTMQAGAIDRLPPSGIILQVRGGVGVEHVEGDPIAPV
jgi:hypothetical protein